LIRTYIITQFGVSVNFVAYISKFNVLKSTLKNPNKITFAIKHIDIIKTELERLQNILTATVNEKQA